jgi:hypothetical protein
LAEGSGSFSSSFSFKTIKGKGAEELLALETKASLEFSLRGLSLKLTPDFDEFISYVHDVSVAIADVERLKEKVGDMECDETNDCIPPDVAEALKSKLSAASEALERGRNAEAVGWLLDFIGYVEAYGELIIPEAHSLITRAEAIISKIDKGKSLRDFSVEIAASIGGVELTWGIDLETAKFPAPGKDNLKEAIDFKIDLNTEDLTFTTDFIYQITDFKEKRSDEKDKVTTEVEAELELGLNDLTIIESIKVSRKVFPKAAKRSSFFTTETKIDADLDIYQLKGTVLHESKSFTDEEKDELTFAYQLEGAYQPDNLKITASLKGERNNFPHAQSKNRHINRFETEAFWDFGQLESDLEFTALFWVKETHYPNNKIKDNTTKRHRFKTKMDLDRLTIEGGIERTETKYPNDEVKNSIANKQWIKSNFNLGYAEFTVALELFAMIYPNSPPTTKNKKIKTVEFELKTLSNLLTLSAAFMEKSFPDFPENNQFITVIGAFLEVNL